MKNIIAVDPQNPDPSILTKAASIIQNGGIVALPTDTFYGLAVNPYNPTAVERLFQIKGRHPSKPVILLIDHVSKLEQLIEKESCSPLAEAIMERFWPGPLTLVLKKNAFLNKRITGGTQGIGIRLPDAAIPIGVIGRTGLPVTATSANRSGEKPATTAGKIKQTFGTALDLILDGGACEDIPSTLLDLTGLRPTILRKGKITSSILEAFI